MAYRFKVKQIVNGYMLIDGEYRKVDAEQNFECSTFDDLNDIILTLVDYSIKDVKVEIHKEVIEDV